MKPAGRSSLRRIGGIGALTLAMVFAPAPAPVSAQHTDPVAEARRLRDAGQFSRAAEALDPYLRTYPDDAGVHWMRAQLLYWAGREHQAVTAYERAIALTPNDGVLIADYAQFLIATRRLNRAQQVLQQHRTGDGIVAARQALAHALSPWARVGLTGASDNQPLRTGGGRIEAGLHPSASTTLFARASAAGRSGANNTQRATSRARLGGTWAPGERRMSVGADAGAEVRERTALVGAGSIGTRVAPGTLVRASVERRVDDATLASIDTVVMVNAAEIALDRSAVAKVAGVAAARVEQYEDGTNVNTAYAWVLVPIARALRLGAAAAWQDADESRWDGQAYSPYYTPENVRTGSLLAEFRANAGAGRDAAGDGMSPIALQFNGSYGIGREDAPVSVPGNGRPPTFATRSFSPWSLAGSANMRIGRRTSIELRAEHRETAFYDVNSATLSMLWLAR